MDGSTNLRIGVNIEYRTANQRQTDAGRRLFKRLVNRAYAGGSSSLENRVGSQSQRNEQGARSEAECKTQNDDHDDSLKKDKRTRKVGGGRSRSH